MHWALKSSVVYCSVLQVNLSSLLKRENLFKEGVMSSSF